jgi:hypothetical protein
MDTLGIIIIIIVTAMVLVVLWDIGEWIISKLKN